MTWFPKPPAPAVPPAQWFDPTTPPAPAQSLAPVAYSGSYTDLINVPPVVPGAHAALSGLLADDHPQYYDMVRGDLRYSQVGHTHTQASISGLTTALAGKEPVIAAGTVGQYWRGDKTWQAFPSGGLGDVVGPASATDNAVALWNGTTGKLLKDGVVLGTLATQNGTFSGTSSGTNTGDSASDPVGSAAAAQAAAIATASSDATTKANAAQAAAISAAATDATTKANAAAAASIPQTFAAAKGDLFTASANDTPAIESVGTNSFELLADSAAANGLVWARKARILIPFHTYVGSLLTWTAMPAAARHLIGQSLRCVYPLDLLRYTRARLTVNTGAVAAFAGAKLILRYKTGGFSGTAGAYSDIGTSEVSVTLGTTSTATTSGWIDLATAAKDADSWITIIGTGGNGVLSPTFAMIFAELD